MDGPSAAESTGVPRSFLRPPALRVENLDALESPEYPSVDTPRSPGLGSGLAALPTSPSQRKTKSRAAHAFYRSGSFTSRNSLKDSKVLMVSGIKRSESLLQPDLFRYHNHFEFLGLLGRTHLSEVFKVRHRQTGELFAVKRSRRRFKSKLHRERCLREISAVSALPAHPNIVGQYRAWQEGGHFYIQMDLCDGGSLHQLIAAAEAEGSLLSEEEVWTVAWEVASGLHFLHSNGVLHLDIKPENIYRDSAGACQIGDFGLAVSSQATEWWEEGDGDYVAPELLRAQGSPSPAADVYSLGATLYECATGSKLSQVLHGGGLACDASLPGRSLALQELLRWMLQPDPARRPSAAQVLNYVAQQGAVLLEASAAAAAAAAAAVPAGTAGCTAAAGTEADSAAKAPTPFASPSVATLFAATGLDSLLASPFAQHQRQASLDEGGADSEQRPQEEGAGRVPPCPFLELSQESSGEGDAVAGAPHASQDQQRCHEEDNQLGGGGFSFAPLPHPPASTMKARPTGWPHKQQHRQQPPPLQDDSGAENGGSAAATPLVKPISGRRKFARGIGGPSAAARRAAAAVGGGLQRWVPSLSPLMSEGALTPGALARLSPFSSLKPARGSAGLDFSAALGEAAGPPFAAVPSPAAAGGGSRGAGSRSVIIPGSASHSGSGTPAISPALSPTGAEAAGSLLPGSGAAGGSGAVLRGSTDSREGWHLRRRDLVSPDSDALARSESEMGYSFSCGTGGSVSSLDFMDTQPPTQPDSPEFQSAAPASSAALDAAQATPELFLRALAPPGGALAAAATAAIIAGPSPAAAGTSGEAAYEGEEDGEGLDGQGLPGSGSGPLVNALAWDLHTSPEFLMQLPPGSPASPSSNTEDSLPSRSFSSIRRFPTLDSMGAMQLDAPCPSPAPPLKAAQRDAACAAGGAGFARMGRLSSFSSVPHRLTSTFSLPPAPNASGKAQQAQQQGHHARKRPLSRHNSRRGLMAALSREGSLTGSIDLGPQAAPPLRQRKDLATNGSGGVAGGFAAADPEQLRQRLRLQQQQQAGEGHVPAAPAFQDMWAQPMGGGSHGGIHPVASSSCEPARHCHPLSPSAPLHSLVAAAVAAAEAGQEGCGLGGAVPVEPQGLFAFSPLRGCGEGLTGMTLSDGSSGQRC
ncbi:hypothetical protein N2152v2_000203 [Parachlorella kessleri]